MDLYKSDPEFMRLSEHFAYEEVAENEDIRLDGRTRYLAVLSACMGSGGKEEFSVLLEKLLMMGLILLL